ncbi:MAG TPA: hemolysin III family protein [Balneolales bacterium]|nr:hemolysin III family protein [Balneolales bacterium]HYX07156.1 hemolysin III family protein [Bacteroidales bacterium]
MDFLRKFREPVSGLTHLTGALLSVFGLILLVYQANNTVQTIAFSIYGLSLILLYTASSLYHLLPVSQKIIDLLQRLDHMMIYILIAGTYTPFTLLALHGGLKWGMFSTVWVLAFTGIILKLVWFNAPRWLSTIFYLGMGWLAIVMFPELINDLNMNGIIWIGLGGLSYTIGAVIYATKKPNPFPNVFGFHEIWHIFVLFGSFCHFWSIYQYLPPVH